MTNDNEAHWTVDRKVPVALLCAILAQSAVGIWWAATQSARIDTLERQASTALLSAQTTTNSSTVLSERLTKLETQFSYVISGLDDVKAILRQPVSPHR